MSWGKMYLLFILFIYIKVLCSPSWAWNSYERLTMTFLLLHHYLFGGGGLRWNMPDAHVEVKNNLEKESSSLFSLRWVLGIKPKSSDLEQKPSLRQGLSREALSRQGLSRHALSRQDLSRQALIREALSRGSLSRRALTRRALARWALARRAFSWKSPWNYDLPVSDFLGLQAYTNRAILCDTGIKARVSQILGQCSPKLNNLPSPKTHSFSL